MYTLIEIGDLLDGKTVSELRLRRDQPGLHRVVRGGTEGVYVVSFEVPEPGSLGFVCLGLGLVGLARCRRTLRPA